MSRMSLESIPSVWFLPLDKVLLELKRPGRIDEEFLRSSLNQHEPHYVARGNFSGVNKMNLE